MYINSLKIKNLRCFREAKIELQHRDSNIELKFPNINLLLGNNGSGKSTILRALAVASLYPVLQKNSGLVLNRMVRDLGIKSVPIEDAFLNVDIILHKQDIAKNSTNVPSSIRLISKIRRSGDVEEIIPLNQKLSSPTEQVSTIESTTNGKSSNGNTEDDSSDLHRLVKLSKTYQAESRWKEAEDILFQAIELEPSNHQARLELSKIYQIQNKFKDAEDVLRKLLRMDSKNLSARFEIGKIYQAQNKFDEAENAFLRVLKMDSQNLQTRFELSKIYQAQNKLSDALHILDETIKLEPSNLQARLEQSKIYQIKKRFEDAERILFEILDIDYQNLQARLELSKIYQSLDELKEAENILLEILDIDYQNLQARLELSKVYQSLNKLKKAEDILVGSDLEAIVKEMFQDKSPAFLVVGYGVARRIEENTNYNFKEQTKNRLLRYARVASLFEGNYPLIPLQSWLPKMELSNKDRFDEVVSLINNITPEDLVFEGEYNNLEFWFELHGAKIPFGALSDGYRNFIGWIADLLYHLCECSEKVKNLVDMQGLVLVDEIDLLLHPEWQRIVIESLSEHLPNLQFVFTTHSPMVASSVQRENVYVMETASDDSAIVIQYDESIYGHTAEQVLLSPYFGLYSTRPESFIKDEIEPHSNKAILGSHEDILEMARKLTGSVELDKSKFTEFLKIE